MPTLTLIGFSLMLALTALKTEAHWFIDQCRAPRIRSMAEFAEAELIIPDGPFEGRRFRCDRQPYTRLWFDAIDSGNWQRYVATGPTQSGKSLCAFVVPVLYHLFEMRETVICGLPDLEMAADKWNEDLFPAIERSRYRDELPRRGAGSKGGKVTTIRFTNGATLKFMSGGGGDKSRAAFTSRVLVITETDGMDEASEGSREADKITQLEARTRAYGSRRRIYMECTVSIETGRTWREYKAGTESRLALPCPHCRAWVTPERESLSGWQSAENVIEARERSAFACPACRAEWSEDARRDANRAAKLVHRGQEVAKRAKIAGDPPKTDTLGFRWSAVNNLFVTAADVGADEWKASRSPNEENAEKEMRQFVWAIPHVPEKIDLAPISAEQIMRRMLPIPKGIIPSDCRQLAASIDLGKYLAHWLLMAWGPDASCHIVDYGRIEVAGDEIGVERALLAALRQFRDLVELGWQLPDKTLRQPELALIDAGYQIAVVQAFVAESGARYMAAVGRGAGQLAGLHYHRPKHTHVGEEYHVSRLEGDTELVETNADHWKSFLHARATTPMGSPGALSLYNDRPEAHLSLAKHLTSEKQIEEFVAGKGTILRWVRQQRNNHWFDAAYMTCVAGHMLGARLADEPAEAPENPILIAGDRRPDGRGWHDR